MQSEPGDTETHWHSGEQEAQTPTADLWMRGSERETQVGQLKHFVEGVIRGLRGERELKQSGGDWREFTPEGHSGGLGWGGVGCCGAVGSGSCTTSGVCGTGAPSVTLTLHLIHSMCLTSAQGAHREEPFKKNGALKSTRTKCIQPRMDSF